MGAVNANSPLETIRKAIALQRAFIARGCDVRRHHHATLKSLRLSEAMILAGFELDAVFEAIKAVGGGDCRPLVPETDQRNASPPVHGQHLTMEQDSCLTNQRTIP